MPFGRNTCGFRSINTYSYLLIPLKFRNGHQSLNTKPDLKFFFFLDDIRKSQSELNTAIIYGLSCEPSSTHQSLCTTSWMKMRYFLHTPRHTSKLVNTPKSKRLLLMVTTGKQVRLPEGNRSQHKHLSLFFLVD